MENIYSELVNEGKKGTKFQWTPKEDDKLVECLLELAGDVKWKANNGFKPSFIAKLKELMEKKLPQRGIKGSPHIESIYKTLRRQYRAIVDMLGPNANGFGWNDDEKMVVVWKQIFEDWVQGHPDAKGLWNKCFPHFDDLALVFGNDKASGDKAQHAIDAIEESERRMKVFNELLKIEGLSILERIKVGELLTTNTSKCDYFYALPGDVRYDCVIQVLTDAGVNPLYM